MKNNISNESQNSFLNFNESVDSSEDNDLQKEQLFEFNKFLKQICPGDTIPTIYMPAMNSVSELVRSPDVRAVIAFREVIHNLISYRQSNVNPKCLIASYYEKSEDTTRFIIGTNAEPFKDVADVAGGCRPFMSKNIGNSVYGGGLKLAAFINNTNNYELTIASFTKDHGFVSVTGTIERNEAKWELTTQKYKKILSGLMRKTFKDYNVYYIIRQNNFAENYTNPKNMADLAFMVGNQLDKYNVEIKFFDRNAVFGDRPKNKNYESIDSVSRKDPKIPNIHCNILSKNKYLEKYCHKTFMFDASDVSHINDQTDSELKTEANYDARVYMHVFPGFSPKSSSDAGILSTLDGYKAYITGMTSCPRNSVYFHMPCLTNKMFKKDGKDLFSRLETDAIYFGLDAPELLGILGLPRVTGIQVFDSNEFLQEYSSLLNNNIKSSSNTNQIALSPENTLKMKPFVVFTVEIQKINWIKKSGVKIDLSKITPEEIMLIFGGVMHGIFLLNGANKVRRVLRTIFSAIESKVTKEIRDYFKKLIPAGDDPYVKIENIVEETINRLWCYYLDNDGKVINEYDLNRKYRVLIRDSTNNFIIDPEDLEIVKDRGHYITSDVGIDGEKHAVLTIGKMKNSVTGEDISIEDYKDAINKHGSQHKMVPRRDVKVRRKSEGGRIYGIGTVSDIPKLPNYNATNPKINKSGCDVEGKKGKKNISEIKYYESLGDPTLYCIFRIDEKDPRKNQLVINKDNPICHMIFSESELYNLSNIAKIKEVYRFLNDTAKYQYEFFTQNGSIIWDKSKEECRKKYAENLFSASFDGLFSKWVHDARSELGKLKTECERLLRYKNKEDKKSKNIGDDEENVSVENEKTTKESC